MNPCATIITENITLDGVIDAAEGWFAPAGEEDVEQSDLIAALSTQRDAAGAFLVERTTFEELRGLRGPLNQEIHALKSAIGADIVVTGSMTLVRALIADGLVDEYRLFVYPVVLGRGRRLFADATDLPRLQLIDTQPFRSGIVLLRYRSAARRAASVAG